MQGLCAADLYLFVRTGASGKSSCEPVTEEPLGMFEAIYAGAESGATKPPWDYGAARPQLVEWADARNLAGHGREALVVGCGYGADAEFLAERGYRTTGFDFSPTAVAAARRQHPETEVTYVVADVLNLPGRWKGSFDLVVESLTVQSMPPAQHGSRRRTSPRSSLREAPCWSWRSHATTVLR